MSPTRRPRWSDVSVTDRPWRCWTCRRSRCSTAPVWNCCSMPMTVSPSVVEPSRWRLPASLCRDIMAVTGVVDEIGIVRRSHAGRAELSEMSIGSGIPHSGSVATAGCGAEPTCAIRNGAWGSMVRLSRWANSWSMPAAVRGRTGSGAGTAMAERQTDRRPAARNGAGQRRRVAAVRLSAAGSSGSPAA